MQYIILDITAILSAEWFFSNGNRLIILQLLVVYYKLHGLYSSTRCYYATWSAIINGEVKASEF